MAYDEQEARQLVARIAAGDSAESAESTLHAMLEQRVLGALRGRCDTFADAEDIAQIAWLRFFLTASAGRYDAGRASVVTFLLLIASRAFSDYYRAGKKDRKALLMSTLEVSAEKSGSAWSLENIPAPVEPVDAQDWFLRADLLALVYQGIDRPAHEILVFGFNVTLSWEPRLIVRRLGPCAPLAAGLRLIDETVAQSQIPEEELRPVFASLLGGLAKYDTTTLQSLWGESRSGTDAVRRWAHNVKRRAVAAATNDPRFAHMEQTNHGR